MRGTVNPPFTLAGGSPLQEQQSGLPLLWIWTLAVLLLCAGTLAQAASALNVNQQLTANQYLASDNAKYRFYLQGDGNLVLRDWTTQQALWSAATQGKGGTRLTLQTDGNLVLYTAKNKAVWSTKTNGKGGQRLALQDDANLVLYTAGNSAIWSTGTSVDSGGGDSGGSDPMVGTLSQIKALGGTIVLDWDNTIDIDSDYTVGKTAPQWMNAFAVAGVDAWLVTGNGNEERIESAVMDAVSSANESYWSNLLSNKSYYGEGTGQKEDKYALIVGSRAKWQFMIADDAGDNIDDFRNVTSGQGYLYEPDTGYATYDEFLGHLQNFLKQLQNNSGSGGGTGGNGIQHIGTTQVWDGDGQGLKINRPSGTQTGDLLVLALHRTDDHLPIEVSGWKRVAECFKEDNGYQCQTVANCTTKSGNFCDRFSSKYTGRDLAQAIFHKTVGSSEAGSYTFNLNKDSTGHPGWAILTALRGASTSSPVRAWAHTGCDNNADSLFPSVDGRKGDMLLLSQSFDDAVSQSNFGAPDGTSTLGYVSNSDEAGFLFGGLLTSDGATGSRKTHGDGASSCKDALLSLTIKAQ